MMLDGHDSVPQPTADSGYTTAAQWPVRAAIHLVVSAQCSVAWAVADSVD